MYSLRGLGAEAMGPPVDPSQPAESPDVQQQIADIWSYLWEGPGAGGTVVVQTAPAASDGSFTSWVNQHSGVLLAGAGGLLALSFLRGRR